MSFEFLARAWRQRLLGLLQRNRERYTNPSQTNTAVSRVAVSVLEIHIGLKTSAKFEALNSSTCVANDWEHICVHRINPVFRMTTAAPPGFKAFDV